MRQRLPSALRSSRPLHLELFETRCLLSGGGSLLNPLLSPPPLLNFTTLATTPLAPPALPAINATNTITQTTANLLNGFAGGVSTPRTNTVIVLPQAATTGLSTISAATASLLTSVNNFTAAIADPLPGLVGATTNAVPAFVSPSLPLNPVEIASDLAGAVPISFDIGLRVEGSGINVGLGQKTGPLATTIDWSGKRLQVEVAVAPVANGPTLPVNATIVMSGETVFHWDNVVQALSSGGDEPSEIGPSLLVVNVSPLIQTAGAFPDQITERRLSLERDSESATLDHSPFFTFVPLPVDSLTAVVTDSGGGADAALEPDYSAAPGLARQVPIEAGASDTEEDSPVFPPSSQGVLADLFPLDLTSLEGDIQTFLEQLEQLGAELSSMLGRMNLSPLLMAAAITALAGEMVRRQWHHRPQPRPLLASFAGAPAECGLPDPWSAENL
jgi:hypothetical protein